MLASVCLFQLLGNHTLRAQATEVQGGEIVKIGSQGVKAITVDCPDAALQAQLQRLFQLHGAFDLSTEDPAFDFRFQPVGANQMQLEISSRGQGLFTQTVTAGSRRDAALLAADLAVQKTTGLPGFFGGRIAFVSQRTGSREIYTSSLLFDDVRQLTQENSNCILPSFSPNGRQLLYTGYHQSGFPDIFKVSLDNGRRSVFANYRGTNSGAVYSADGRQIAMILSSSGNPELYVTRADGSGTPRRLTNNASVESSPTFSPDGQWLALTSDRLGSPQIYQIPVQGGPLRRVATNLSGYCTEPDWNPRDPTKLVFTAAMSGSFQLALHDYETGKSVFLTSGSGDCTEPAWLNDGRHVLYTRRLSGSSPGLWIIDTESGRSRQLTPDSLGSASQGDFVFPN